MVYVFEGYSLDPDRRELRRGTDLVAVEPQVFDILQLLISERERVVSKDDLIAAVWGGRIVSESTLSSRITAARHAVGDSGEKQRLIRTIARRGLRFVGEVREVGDLCSIRTPQATTSAVQLVGSASEVPSDVAEKIDRNVIAQAILAAEVVGYSRLMEADEAGTIHRLKAIHSQITEPLIAQHHGRLVKLMGDGSLVVFDSPIEAVACAVAIQKAVREHNASVPEDERIAFRIGVNLGDVVLVDSDIYGDGVNVAAHLEQLCDPGGVMLSAPVHDQLHGRFDVSLEFASEQHIKNVAGPVRVYRLKPGAAPTRYRLGARYLRWLGAGVAAAVLAVVVFTGMHFFWPQEPLQQALPMPDRPALAVLPFNNVSGNPEQGYLADGLADDIITELARNRDLLVMARNSSFSFKGQDKSVPYIARRLGVRYVLDGSVRRRGEQVFFNAQLIDGHDARLVWAERYTFKTGDVYRVQEELVEHVAGVLLSHVRETEKAASLRRPPNNLDVYELTLRGIAHKHQLNKEAYLQGRAELERAVALDPNFAPAHIYLGYLNGIDAIMALTGALSAADLPAAIAEIRRGIALDPNLPIGYQALGHHFRLAGQIEEAHAALERAVALGPGDAENWILLGAVQNSLGHHERALATIERALALNPVTPVWYLSGHANALYALDRFEDAHRATANCLTKAPSYYPCRLRAVASVQALGRTSEAVEHIAELLRQRPISSVAEASALGFPRDPPLQDRFLDHLRAAGLPEEASR